LLDFTKQYNRLRQQLLPNKTTNPAASAPAINQPRKAPLAKPLTTAQQKDNNLAMIGDQIEALSTKFEGRIHLGEHNLPSPVPELKMGSKKAAGDRYHYHIPSHIDWETSCCLLMLDHTLI
jgi:RIO kinase 1